MVTSNEPHAVQFRQKMDSFHPNLWAHPELITTLDLDQAQQALRYLLELACQAQNMVNITFARQALLTMPHDWLVTHIGPLVESQLDLEAEWEYRRLGELYLKLAPELLPGLLTRGQVSTQPNVREAAADLATLFTRGKRPTDALALAGLFDSGARRAGGRHAGADLRVGRVARPLKLCRQSVTRKMKSRRAQ